MPTLLTALKPQDLGFLRILAEFWGLPEPEGDTEQSREALAEGIRSPDLVAEVVGGLPTEAAATLSELLQTSGRAPWIRLNRRHGPLRQMGPARRDRERPHDHPKSPLETLYYRGLIARAFFDTTDGPLEFGFIPDDLLPLIPVLALPPERTPGHPARDDEAAETLPATDEILDDLTTFLAASRSGASAGTGLDPDRMGFYRSLLSAAGIVGEDGRLDVDRTRTFLETPRGEALAGLVVAWQGSVLVDELGLHPEIEIAAHAERDPVRQRSKLLEAIAGLPPATWWSLPAFAAGIEALEPEFLRPAGELDSRYVKDRATGAFLGADAGWGAVEGAYLRWLITGPLHWLGLVDLAGPVVGNGRRGKVIPRVAFRASRWWTSLLAGSAPAGMAEETEPVHVRSDGRISVPRLAPRAVRYLVARFCDWEEPVRDEYRYRASPKSLLQASDRGLKVGQLIALLAKHADTIPPNITRALKSWEQFNQAGRIETYPVLRLPSGEALEELQRSRAGRFLGDVLGPAAVALKPGSEARVLAVLNELGYLAEIVEPKR
jgi:hypothetical protein